MTPSSQSLLFERLRAWRDEQARIEGVEGYRVLSNTTLQALLARMPLNGAELMEVKGIKEAKSRKYGKALLSLLGTQEEAEATAIDAAHQNLSQEPLSVSQFLDSINLELSGMAARIRGEVSTVDNRERVIYFTLKDAAVEGTLQCLIFRSQYEVSGVTLVPGDEIIVEGVPEVYKPSGRFSLRAGTIEYAGEGALKKAYEALKAKLESEGLLAPERKRPLPALVQRIALITSSEGAAIGDFTMNVGQNGLRVDFYPTAVEGARAVQEIIKALRYFRNTAVHYDCLVLIRGGGSLESLQAFNNEALLREIAAMPMPVLAGIGHERDITLASLVSDVMVSTPTAAARRIATSWDEARIFQAHVRTTLLQSGKQLIESARAEIAQDAHALQGHFVGLRTGVDRLEQGLREHLHAFPHFIRQIQEAFDGASKRLLEKFSAATQAMRATLERSEVALRHHDPQRLLRLGYSLVRQGGVIVRSTAGLTPGEILDIQLSDGKVESKVTKIL